MLFFLIKQTIRVAIQAVSQASCTESTENAVDSSPEIAQEAKASSLDPL